MKSAPQNWFSLSALCIAVALSAQNANAQNANAQNANAQNANAQNANAQNANAQNANAQNANAQNANAQNANAQNATDAGWCVTPRWGQLFAARTLRSFRGVIRAFDRQTNVIKVDVEYRVGLDGKTVKTQTKSVEVVLTPRTTLQMASEKQVASSNGEATTTTIGVKPMQRAAITVGQSVVFSFDSPLAGAANQSDANDAQPPAQVEARAVFIGESAKPKPNGA